MRSGSYNYLCYKTADELITCADDIQHMADRLGALGYASDATHATLELLAAIRQFDDRVNTIRISNLDNVWRAVEWWDDCDSSEDEVRSALADYQAKHDNFR